MVSVLIIVSRNEEIRRHQDVLLVKGKKFSKGGNFVIPFANQALVFLLTSMAKRNAGKALKLKANLIIQCSSIT